MENMKKIAGQKMYGGGKHFPSISISDKDLPEIKDWQIGGKYKLIVEVEMTAIRKNQEMLMMETKETPKETPKETINATFDVRAIGIEEEETDYHKDYAKKRSSAKANQ